MVYLIENPDRNICKIGCSENPETRLMGLQTATPDPLVLRATLPGSYPEEKELHQRFAAARLGGEWFNMTPEIMECFGIQQHFIFFEKIIQIMGGLKGSELKSLLWMALNARWNHNTIELDGPTKQKMEREVGIKSADNSITALVKKGHLRRLGRGVYQIDPETTWRGDLHSRAKSIEVFLTYTIENP